MGIKVLTAAVSAALLATISVPGFVSAASSTTTVTEKDVARQLENTQPTKNWVIYTRTATPGTATFRNGPATPPINAGSLELSTVSGNDKVYIFNFDHIGTKLSDVNAIGYSTYRSAGTDQQDAAINLEVDENGPAVAGGYTNLVFEPVYNTDQGPVVNDQWQNWDAYKGGNAIWWSSHSIPGALTTDAHVSWNTILANNPDATIVGGIGINQGSGNPALTTAVDAFTFGTTANTNTYDFELTPPKPVKATDKDQCKNGGYLNFQTQYKNQGDCVSSVASNGKAKGNPTPTNDSSFGTLLMRLLGL